MTDAERRVLLQRPAEHCARVIEDTGGTAHPTTGPELPVTVLWEPDA